MSGIFEAIKTLDFKKIDRRYRIAFLSTVIIGLLVHMYKFTNTLLNHDSVFCYYDSQNAIVSGRWFLTIACSFSSYFDLPWVTGLMTVFFTAITAVLIVKILDIKNELLCVLIGGLLITSPFVTDILFYGFTSDGFAMGMLFAVVSVYCAVREKQDVVCTVLSIVFLCLSCAIYQAFVSFALMLTLVYIVMKLLNDDYAFNKLKFIIKNIVIYVISLSVYFVLWKLLMWVQNVEAIDYQGISDVGIMNFAGMVCAFVKMIKNIFVLIFGCTPRNVLANGISIYGIINVIILLLLTVCIMLSIIKSKIYKRVSDTVLLMLCLTAMPFAVYMWMFTSPKIEYAPRMLQSVLLLIILMLLLAKHYSNKLIKAVSAIIVSAYIFNCGIMANVCYFYLEQENKASLSEGSRVIQTITELYGKESKLFISGNRYAEVVVSDKYNSNQVSYLSGSIEKTLLFDEIHAILYLNNTFNCNFSQINEEEKIEIMDNEAFEKMPVWPQKNSIAKIGDVVVIKLSE